MQVLYNIGSLDIFRNLRYLFLTLAIILAITIIIKAKKIFENYSYKNKELSVLELIEEFSNEEFELWIKNLLENKGVNNLSKINKGVYLGNKNDESLIIYTNKDYSIIDKEEAKILDGISIIEEVNNILTIVTGDIDNSFNIFLRKKNLNFNTISKEEFKLSYQKFISLELKN